MSRIYSTLDLSKFTNHKLVYDTLPDGNGDFGLDKICILSKNFSCGRFVNLNGIDFAFTLEKYDNIYCENQEIEVNKKAKSIHILGFSYWGDTYEYFKMFFSDGTSENLKVVLPDWSHSVDTVTLKMRAELNDCKVKTGEIFLSSGNLIHMIYLHHFSYAFETEKMITNITFPDNMFMHIFAITLED